jgi:hypothetical protein
MYRKDVNELSPVRVFERSIRGGLGRGNIGLVLSRAGVGKTAFLVDVALDDLMRDRKVLHVDTARTAERLREYYDEIFHDLAETMRLEDKPGTHLKIERNRMIHSFLNGTFDLQRVDQALDYMGEHVHFQPYCVILDGTPDWEAASRDTIEAQLRAVKELATRRNVELWLSATSHREEERDERGVPLRLVPYLEYVSVAIQLVPQSDHVRLQLVKDHDNPHLAELHMELDPKTLLLKWE